MSPSEQSFDADRFDEIAGEYTARVRRGEMPSIEEYIDRYPELEEQILEFFPLLATVEDLKVSPPTTDPALRRLELPERVGDYRIFQELGRGGMGVVYEAEQQSLGRRVALKVLPQPSAGSASSRERFQREARAAASLHHSNIVPVFEVGHDEHHDFYAMQLILGHGLDEIIDELRRVTNRNVRERASDDAPTRPGDAADTRRIAQSLQDGRFADRSLPTQHAPADSSKPPSSSSSLLASSQSGHTGARGFFQAVARIGEQVADALDYAHARGVVHRDIKPSNLLLDTGGDIWVTDFGLAKTNGVDLTQTGQLVGTLRYMAPERFAGECSTSSDVYALGVTLYELATQQPAFEASDRLKLIEEIRNHEPPRPRTLAPVPSDLETVILTAMARERRHRYPSARAMAEDLERFQQNRPIRARRVSAAERLVRWSRRSPALSSSLFGVIFLLILLTTIFGIGQRRERQQREDFQRQLYRAEMTLAGTASDSVVGLHELERLTREWEKTPADADYLGWEWYHFKALSNQHLFEVELSPGNHGGRVNWTPDGRFVLASDHEGMLEVIDARTGVVVERTRDHSDSLNAIKPSPDGKWVLTNDLSGTALLRDAHTLAVHARFHLAPDGGEIKSVQWHPDSRRFVVAFFGLRAPRVFEREDDGAQMIWQLPDRHGCGAFSPDGRWLATLVSRAEHSPDYDHRKANRAIVVWDLESRKPVKFGKTTQAGLPGYLTWSPDGKRLAWGSLNGVRIWDWENEEVAKLCVASERHGGATVAHGRVSWSADGSYLASSGRDGVMRLWDPATGQELRHYTGSSNWLAGVACHPRRPLVAAITRDRRLRVWDVSKPSPVLEGTVSPGAKWSKLNWSEDGDELLIITLAASFVDPLPSGIATSLQAEELQLRVHAWDDDRLWTSTNGEVQLRRRSGEIVARQKVPDLIEEALGTSQRATSAADEVTNILRAPGNTLIVTTQKGALWWFDESLRDEGRQHPTGLSRHMGIAVTRDGESLIVGKYRHIEWYDARTGELSFRIPVPTHIWSIDFDPTGRRMAVTWELPEVAIFETSTGDRRLSLTGHLQATRCAAFHPDGRRVATGSDDHTTRLWDPRNGDLITIFEEGEPVHDVAWSPDGSTLAVVLKSGRLRIRKAPDYPR